MSIEKLNTSVLLSVIIPCYNDWEYIGQAVDSTLNQTYPYKEIIVIDDGSNSKTKDVLKRIEPKITKLITQQNKGQSTARNIGIKEAKGHYILVLDSDDYFEPTFCEKAITVFEANDGIKLVTCHANLLFTEKKDSYVFKPKGGTIADFLTSNNALGSAMFKKEDWSSIGGYDETMKKGFEDWEFYMRLLEHGGVARVIAEPLYNYRKRKNTTTSKANNIKYDLLKYIYFKHENLYKINFQLFSNFKNYNLT